MLLTGEPLAEDFRQPVECTLEGSSLSPGEVDMRTSSEVRYINGMRAHSQCHVCVPIIDGKHQCASNFGCISCKSREAVSSRRFVILHL